MHLGPTEEARLLIFQAAELARRTRSRGLRLNAPEAIAIACDEMHAAARAGATFEEVLEAGRGSVAPRDLLEGVDALIREIRLEVLLEEGTRLVVLRDLGASDSATAESEPGAVVSGGDDIAVNEGLESFDIEVVNSSDHQVRVSSHFPFEHANHRLAFDRDVAVGTRLDIAAGDVETWQPGERRTVRLVRVSPSGSREDD